MQCGLLLNRVNQTGFGFWFGFDFFSVAISLDVLYMWIYFIYKLAYSDMIDQMYITKEIECQLC